MFYIAHQFQQKHLYLLFTFWQLNMKRPKTSKTASVLIRSKQTRFYIERYLIRQDNNIYTFLIKLSFSSIGQDKSKLQKQVSKLLISIKMADW